MTKVKYNIFYNILTYIRNDKNLKFEKRDMIQLNKYLLISIMKQQVNQK